MREAAPKGGFTPAERRAALNQLLKLANCMRAHGFPKFPDPSARGGNLNLVFGPGYGVDPSSPQFKAAQQAWHMPGP